MAAERPGGHGNEDGGPKMEKTGNRAAGRERISAGKAGIGAFEQPNGVLECWSVVEMGRLSHPLPLPHVRRPVRRLVRRSPAKAEASAKPDPPPQR